MSWYLSHKKYNRQFLYWLFLTIVLDGAMRGFVLAYDIAPMKNTYIWAWFFRMLLKSIANIDHLPFLSFFIAKRGWRLFCVRYFLESFITICATMSKPTMVRWQRSYFGELFMHIQNRGKLVWTSVCCKSFILFEFSTIWFSCFKIFPFAWFFCCLNQEMLYCFIVLSRFDAILHCLDRGPETTISWGRGVVTYINKVPPTVYVRHAFPLPRLGNITNNLVEQANNGLLLIQEFLPLKLMIEMWSNM